MTKRGVCGWFDSVCIVRVSPFHAGLPGSVEKPKDEPDLNPDDVRVLRNGRVYYPASPNGAGHEVQVIEDASLCRWAALGSHVVGSVEGDDIVTALYWCYGDEVDDEHVWWVLQDKDGDELNNGARLHASVTFQRPL